MIALQRLPAAGPHKGMPKIIQLASDDSGRYIVVDRDGDSAEPTTTSFRMGKVVRKDSYWKIVET